MSGSGSLIGGAGFDTLVVMAENSVTQHSRIGSWRGISGFEKIDIRGKFFVNDLSMDVLRENHSEQIIDDQGKAHQGVFIIDGNSDDRVSFAQTGTRATKGEQVIFENKTYESYLYDSNGTHYEVWIQQGISIA